MHLCITGASVGAKRVSDAVIPLILMSMAFVQWGDAAKGGCMRFLRIMCNPGLPPSVHKASAGYDEGYGPHRVFNRYMHVHHVYFCAV